MFKIIAPNKQYTGTSAGISFSNGIGYTNDERLLDWFKEHGYTVDESEEIKAVSYDEHMKLKKTHEDLMNHHEELEKHYNELESAHKELQVLYDDAVKQLVPEKEINEQSEPPKEDEVPKTDKQPKNK